MAQRSKRLVNSIDELFRVLDYCRENGVVNVQIPDVGVFQFSPRANRENTTKVDLNEEDQLLNNASSLF